MSEPWNDWAIKPTDLSDDELIDMIHDVLKAQRSLEDYHRELVGEQVRRHGINQMTFAYM